MSPIDESASIGLLIGRSVAMHALVIAAAAFAPTPALRSAVVPRCASPVLEKGRESEDVAGAVANTFGDVFANMFKPNAEKQAEIDRAYAEQLEVAARRRNPDAYIANIKKNEARREAESVNFLDKMSWQRNAKDPLAEFKKRQKQGKIAPLGYEDVPKGGIPLPSASFGVGGEFGVGGKYDNGMRFDLRLPFADKGWVEEKPTKKSRRTGTGSTEDKKRAAKARGMSWNDKQAAMRQREANKGKQQKKPGASNVEKRTGWFSWD